MFILPLIILLIMALFSSKNAVSIPMTNRSFYQKTQIAGLNAEIKLIRQRFGKFINATAKGTNIPDWLLESFIFIESAGNPNAQNGNTYGLGQISPDGIQDVIILENKDKKINAFERSALKKQLGTRADTILNYKSLGQSIKITKADLLNPEFNILCMSIYLSRLIDQVTVNGKIRYDLLPYGYNIGYFAFLKQKAALIAKTTNQVIDGTNQITANYILKFVGRNGMAENILRLA